jgi:radical SAM superfamily enzyme YgiQ (UPF0313 family)
MNRASMKQVLFVQLPPPRFSFAEPPTNIPLAAGFLASAMEAASPGDMHVEILDSDTVDVLGDQALLAKIVDRRPDVLAMTLYVWNVNRSLFLAANVKRFLPGTRILVGGPEVTADNAWVMRHPAVEAGVFGEGESRIVSALHALFPGQDLSAIPGTFCKQGKTPVLNTNLAQPWDLALAAYPYLDGKIRPSRDGTLFLETMRGCPFRCRYCYYHKSYQGIRFHPRSHVEQVLDFAYNPESAVREMYLMDPTFNASPRFRELLRSMATRRQRKDVPLHTELRADLLTREDVLLLKDAGLVSAEVGLQTTNPAALLRAGRKGDPRKVVQGVTFLKEAGIEVTTGIILGLPEDTPEGFQTTLQWLEQTAAYSVVHPFVLAVLPGTDFRESAHMLGLEYDPRPPYYVRSTRTFPADAFRPALLECERIFDMELDHIAPPSLVDCGPHVIRDPSAAEYVSKWIVNPDAPRWAKVLSQMAAKTTDPFTLWFRGSFREQAMLSILSGLSSTNPHTCLHVVLELAQLPDSAFLHRALDAAASPGHFLNRSYQPLYAEDEVVNVNFWVLHPDPGDPHSREEIAEQYGSVATVIWDVYVSDRESLSQTAVPLLFSVKIPDTGDAVRDVFKTMQIVHEDDGQDVRFREWKLADAWQILTGQLNPSFAFTESILLTE